MSNFCVSVSLLQKEKIGVGMKAVTVLWMMDTVFDDRWREKHSKWWFHTKRKKTLVVSHLGKKIEQVISHGGQQVSVLVPITKVGVNHVRVCCGRSACQEAEGQGMFVRGSFCGVVVMKQNWC